MTFSEWVDEKFGNKGGTKAADFLGLGYRTFRSYYALERFPRPKTCQIIVVKSNDLINIQRWQQDYTRNKNKKVGE